MSSPDHTTKKARTESDSVPADLVSLPKTTPGPSLRSAPATGFAQRVSSHGLLSKTSSHLSEYNKDEWGITPSEASEHSTHMDTVNAFTPFSEESPALRYTPLAGWKKARAGLLELPHGAVKTPVFMPVGTQGTIKGVCAKQVEKMDIKLILGNTYHLGVRPGTDIVHRKGGLHQFMNWNNNMLSDSGGFQMVSLVSFAEITETGVSFQSPVDGSQLLLTPERSIQYQNELGTDIMMALDDVCSSLITGPRVQEAMERSIRWLDRCIAAHKKPHIQNLFAIIQGGLDADLRVKCLDAMIARKTPGYAIGGLAGGEDKESFWKVVDLCTKHLPTNKPRYLMGVGYPMDLLVCVAMGVDMFDCVWPCRTARFGTAIVPSGLLKITQTKYANDNSVLDPNCPCDVCSKYKYPRSYLHHMATKTPLGCHLLTQHNLGYLAHYMDNMRQSLLDNKFPEFVNTQLELNFPDKHIPSWMYDALVANELDMDVAGFIRDETRRASADVHQDNEKVYHDKIDPLNLGLEAKETGQLNKPEKQARSHQRTGGRDAVNAANAAENKKKRQRNNNTTGSSTDNDTTTTTTTTTPDTDHVIIAPAAEQADQSTTTDATTDKKDKSADATTDKKDE